MAASWAEHLKNILHDEKPVILNKTKETKATKEPIERKGDYYTIERPRIIIKPLEKQIYPELDNEINKIKALNIFKRRLIHNILKYFRYHKLFDRKRYIERQMYNHFTNWFFQLNLDNDIENFIPLKPFEIQENLDYIFNERAIQKTVDFDPKLLAFDAKYIKDLTGVYEIIRKEKDNNIFYCLKTNAGLYRLLPISNTQYKHLTKIYSGPKNKFDEYICIILARYKFLGGMNNHLSIPPSVYKHLDISFELFGTPLNTMTKTYCSPFPEYETYFGSIGSFFNYTLEKNTIYGANPPFNAKLIERMVQKIETELPNIQNTTIYVAIPKWQNDFASDTLLQNSKYIIDDCSLDKDKFPYYHYYKQLYVSAVDSRIFVLANESNAKTCEDIMKMWPYEPKMIHDYNDDQSSNSCDESN
jgi:hypothetical protein